MILTRVSMSFIYENIENTLIEKKKFHLKFFFFTL